MNSDQPEWADLEWVDLVAKDVDPVAKDVDLAARVVLAVKVADLAERVELLRRLLEG